MKVDAFFRVKYHALLGSTRNKKFQRAKPDRIIKLFELTGSKVFLPSQALPFLFGNLDHFIHEVVSVNNGAFATFHFTGGQFNHAVTQMINTIGRR